MRGVDIVREVTNFQPGSGNAAQVCMYDHYIDYPPPSIGQPLKRSFGSQLTRQTGL